MPIDVSTSPGFPNDTGGIMRTAASAVVDNIFIFQDGDGTKWKRVIDGKYKAQWAMQGDGSSQMTTLDAILAHASVNEVVFDSNTAVDYTLTGTLTIPTGKRIRLEHDNRIIGSVTITGGTIHCDKRANVFATTVKLVDVQSATGEWSVMNWGAVGDNSNDDTAECQAAFNNIMRNFTYPGTSNLIFPAGIYKISQGLVLYYDSTDSSPVGVSSFFGVKIYGEGLAYAPSGFAASEIRCTHNDNFAICIQRGKGVVISDLAIQGTNNLGALTQTQVWGGDRSIFVTGGARTNALSPYSGIVVDPFNSNITSGSGNQYPGMTDYYVDNQSGGSTDCRFYNLHIYGFVVGVCWGPSNSLLNCECMVLQDCWIGSCLDAVTNCQSQGRMNIVKNLKVWSPTHTIFNTITYGASNGILPEVDGMNIAGAVYQLFWCDGQWTYGHFTQVYAENMYRIGRGSSTLMISFYQSYFNFDFGGNILAPLMPEPNNLIDGGVYSFHDCIIHVYDEALPNVLMMNVTGLISFKNCTIDAGFYICQSIDNKHFAARVEYDNCSADGAVWRNISTDHLLVNPVMTSTQILDQIAVTRGLKIRISGVSQTGVVGFSVTRSVAETIHDTYAEPVFIESGITVTLVAVPVEPSKLNCRFTSADGTQYRTGDNLVLYKTDAFTVQSSLTLTTTSECLAGAIRPNVSGSSDGIIGNQITTRGSADWGNGSLVAGSSISGCLIYNLPFKKIRPIIVCTATSGSGSFTNCVLEQGAVLTTVFADGMWVRGKGMSVRSRVTGVSGTTITLSHTSPVNDDNYVLFTYDFIEEGQCENDPMLIDFPSASHGFCKGTYLKNVGTSNPEVLGWHCITSGVLNSAKPPVFVAVTDGRSRAVTLTGNGTVVIPTNTNVDKIRVDPVSDLTAFKIGTSSGADDVVSTQAVPAEGEMINISQYFGSGATLYIEGITSNTVYVLYKE
jgi:hypothetical protein